MKNLFTFSFLFLLFISSRAQEHVAPTLQIGLDGVSVGKGIPDVELLFEIIHDKKQEIQSELVRYMFLEKLGQGGSTIYGYVDNTLQLLQEPIDQETRVKRVIENTVILGIITGYSQYVKKIVDSLSLIHI